jgi:hypothetical protein
VKFPGDVKWRGLVYQLEENLRFSAVFLMPGDSVEILRAGAKRKARGTGLFGDDSEQDSAKYWCSEREHRSGSSEEDKHSGDE